MSYYLNELENILNQQLSSTKNTPFGEYIERDWSILMNIVNAIERRHNVNAIERRHNRF